MVKFEDLEIWDHIKGYEGFYKVSSKGRVYSIRRGKFMKPSPDNYGYYRLSLSKDGKKRDYTVHRLVALTFYFVENDTLQIDHNDRDKTNNNLLNLRFCSNSENQRNTGLQKNNTSGYKGIRPTPYKTWRATIYVDGKQKNLGSFTTKEAAYDAYCKASREFHGEFGYAP